MTTTTALAPTGPLARLHSAVALDDDALHRLRRTAVVGLVLLNLCDLVLTRKLLGLGGIEANPIMAPLIHGGWAIAFKLGLPLAIGIRHLRRPLDRKVVLGLCWMCVIYSCVVLWNAHLLNSPLLAH
jgi:hypothetical protein